MNMQHLQKAQLLTWVLIRTTMHSYLLKEH